jgi:hypothetical protein
MEEAGGLQPRMAGALLPREEVVVEHPQRLPQNRAKA